MLLSSPLFPHLAKVTCSLNIRVGEIPTPCGDKVRAHPHLATDSQRMKRDGMWVSDSLNQKLLLAHLGMDSN